MPKILRKKSITNRKKRTYKGGQQPMQVVQQLPQQVVTPQPTQVAIATPVQIPKAQLKQFPKKIRINVTSNLKSVIEAPEDAQYILSERLNASAKYGNPDVYIAQFGNDEETGTPIDIYSGYVYERLKDLKLPFCQELKFRGDKKVPGGFLTSDSTRRQQCAESIKTLKKDDNRILQAWIDNIDKNGLNFLQQVSDTISKLQDDISDLQSQQKQVENDLTDATKTLNDNINGIDRETQQHLQEIKRIIQDKEENMGGKIDQEINNLQIFVKEETKVVAEIDALDAKIDEIIKQIEMKQKELLKISNGLTKTQAQLQNEGINLDILKQEIERSIQMYAMSGGKRRRKKLTKKTTKKTTKKVKKSTKKGGSSCGMKKKKVGGKKKN